MYIFINYYVHLHLFRPMCDALFKLYNYMDVD